MSVPVSPLLELSGLTVSRAGRMLLDRATLALGRGSVAAVTGGAGSGKSVLLRTVAGLPMPGFTIDGQVAAVGRRLLLVQGAVPAPHRTLAVQAAEVLRHHLGLDAVTAARRLIEALDRLGTPAAARRLDLYPHEMGEVQRRRSAIALALAAAPSVLLADQPGVGLDPTVRAQLTIRLAEWARETGAALLLAGRPEEGIAGAADKVLRLEGGRLVAEAAAPAPLPQPPAGTGPMLLSVRGLGVSFALGGGRRLKALEDVSFNLSEGETLVLLGESGSGKSLLARSVLGLVLPTEGRVAWSGLDLAATDETIRRRIRATASLLFPDPAASLDPGLSIGAQLAEVLEHLRPDLPAERRGRQVADALEEAGLRADTALLWPAALDPGEAARVGLARALLSGPRALVCDEPVGTLSGMERREFLETLQTIRDRRRLAVLLAAQNAVDGLRMAHRGLVMLAGRVVEEADSATLLDRPLHPFTRALVAAAEGGPPVLEGEAPNPLRPPGGCALRLRCPKARSFCAQSNPSLEEVAPGHRVACHYWDMASD